MMNHMHGGTSPDKRKLEIWVAMGDSEMSGIGSATGLPVDYPGNSDIWKMTGNVNKWRRASEPMSDEGRNGAPLPGVGLAGLFAYWRYKQTGRQIGMVVCSKIGAASDQWGSAGALYKSTVERIKSALIWGDFRGFIHADGANDAIGGLTAWDTNTLAIYSNLATDIPATSGKILAYYQLPVTKPTTASQVNWDFTRGQQAGIQSASRIMITGQSEGPWVSGGGNQGVHGEGLFFNVLAQTYVSALTAY